MRGALRVVGASRRVISEDAVSFVDCLHLFRVAAAIRMMPHGETFIKAFDLILRRSFPRAQNGIIISLHIRISLLPSYPRALLRLAQLLLTFDRVVVSGSARIANLDRLVKLFRGLARVVHERMNPAHRFVSTAEERTVGFR